MNRKRARVDLENGRNHDYTGFVRQNLPVPLTPFIGREQERTTVQQLLRHPDVRLLTITGPGGVGKTRLALEVASELAASFGDGVTAVSLAAIGDPNLVIPAVARTLGLREEGKRPLSERLLSYLQDKQQLLLLDNFEQVIAAAPRLLDILAAAPDIKVLVTSREALRLRGEQEFAVPLLAVPDLARLAQVRTALAQVVAGNTAVTLFVQRARAVRPDFQLTDDNALTIARICARLEGLPLAIELAAVRIKLFSLQALLIHLGEATGRAALPLLTGGPRDLPARQQTLQATIQWSYDLLDPAEQQLFRQLSVFVGGFTLDAAEAVISKQYSVSSEQSELNTDHWPLNTVSSLVDKSLLQQAETDGEPRLSMLTVVREFAAAQLEASGEATTVRQAHAACYLKLAETAVPYLMGPEQQVWLERLEQEHDNLRATLRRSLKRGETETALRLGSALGRFWLLRGYLGEGRQWLEAILDLRYFDFAQHKLTIDDLRREEGDHSKIVALRATVAEVLAAAGILAHHQGDSDRAIALYEESLGMYRQLGDQSGVATTLSALAETLMRLGQFEQAQGMYADSLAIFRTSSDRWGVAHTLEYQGLMFLLQEKYETARPVLEESLGRYRAVADPQGIAHAQQGLGWVVLGLGEMDSARRLFTESLARSQALRDRRGMAVTFHGLGTAALKQGDLATAAPLLKEALALLVELGDRYHIFGCLQALAWLAAAAGQWARAAQLYGATAALRAAIGANMSIVFQTDYERELATIRQQLGQAAFATAWEEGRHMTPEQVLATQSTPTIEATAVSPPTPATKGRPHPDDLTEREAEVLRLLAQGHTNAQIADQLVISLYTVKAHLRNVYGKLDVTTRTAATRYALDHNLV